MLIKWRICELYTVAINRFNLFVNYVPGCMKQILRKEEKVIFFGRCGVSQGFTYVVCGRLAEKVQEDSFSALKRGV